MDSIASVARRFARYALCALAAIPVQGVTVQENGELQGKVIARATRAPIVAARVDLPELKLSALTDEAGKFRLLSVREGEHLLVLRAVGFKPETTTATVDKGGVTVRDFVLEPSAVPLPERRVTAKDDALTGRLAEFHERRRLGAGHFIDEAMLSRADSMGRRLGDVLEKAPGLRVHRGENKAWVASKRALNAGTCVFCQSKQLDRADRSAGAGHACYLDVYVDGVKTFNAAQPENGLFDVNTLPLRSIVAIEAYSGASQVPAKYNQSSGGCGVLLIWTR